ncbi:MAG: hypothetical protein EXS43_13320 [Opitutus sp.]|nr:hypothetical protein [Opitutus sp.]
MQRQVHASHDEFFRFRQGYEWHLFDLGFCKAGVTVCHDTDFFESWRMLARGVRRADETALGIIACQQAPTPGRIHRVDSGNLPS